MGEATVGEKGYALKAEIRDALCTQTFLMTSFDLVFVTGK